MTGQINVNKIVARSGNLITYDSADVVNITLAKGENAASTNLKQGLAKMWGNYDQRGDALGSVTSGDTFNVTSFTDFSEGHIDVAIANDMANATYSINATSHYNGTEAQDMYSRYSGASIVTAGTFRLVSQWENGAAQDAWHHGILVHGDLA